MILHRIQKTIREIKQGNLVPGPHDEKGSKFGWSLFISLVVVDFLVMGFPLLGKFGMLLWLIAWGYLMVLATIWGKEMLEKFWKNHLIVTPIVLTIILVQLTVNIPLQKT